MTTALNSIVGLLVTSCAQGASVPLIATSAPPSSPKVNAGSPPRQPPHSAVASTTGITRSGPASEVLPFSLQLLPIEGPHPTIDDFLVVFSKPCVSTQRVGGGGENHYLAHLEVGGVRSTQRLKARYDGHTARPLLVRNGTANSIDLWGLTDEWTGISPGVHEVVVFAADARGIVPQTANGELALISCRFWVSDAGDVEVLPPPRDQAFVLLSPEGTLHGPDANETLVQVGAALGRADARERQAPGPDTRAAGGVQLVVVRPDGGKEGHPLAPGLFTLAPLRAGDYVLSLEPEHPQATEPRRASTLGYEHRITVNPE